MTAQGFKKVHRRSRREARALLPSRRCAAALAHERAQSRCAARSQSLFADERTWPKLQSATSRGATSNTRSFSLRSSSAQTTRSRIASHACFGLLPTFPLPQAEARFAPVFVDDVTQAFVAAIDNSDTHGRTYQLCGPDIFSLAEIVRFVGWTLGLKRLVVPLPPWLGRVQAWVGEYLLPGKPLSLDNFRSLSEASVCSENGFGAFGIKPQSLGAIVPTYLARARPSGTFSPDAPEHAALTPGAARFRVALHARAARALRVRSLPHRKHRARIPAVAIGAPVASVDRWLPKQAPRY